ncbi:MAG: hypothetical protein N2C12_04910 [Planctomycetales bacterium]
MVELILFAVVNRIWFALPLVVSVSLVYSATRHEQSKPIFYHAFRTAIWILGFMVVAYVILSLLDYYFA